MSSRPNWKKTQSTVDTGGRRPLCVSRTENKEVISCSGQTLRPEPEKKYKGQPGYKPSETSAKAYRLVVRCSGFPLVPEIRRAALLSDSMDHLDAPRSYAGVHPSGTRL